MNSLQRKIETMRFIMITTAEKHSNDLLHPEVIRVSRELDQLIVQAMKSGSSPSNLAVAERASYVS
ncbi:aspartyl-phosphate phosphatase Spo0E family protein [Paenibacillus antri]|nr:aspartyl-phosphate phosphatase Spo0E family protein [Paenibacillus antri]